MKSKHSVSIAMATFNGASFLEEQLKSFANQTILPDELVVTDDCSTDETLDVISSFAASAPFPIYIEKNSERLGYRANFLKAANLCKSDIISFSDQDDVWLPQKLETCLASFESEKIILVYHNALVTSEALLPIASLNQHAPLQSLNPPLSLNPWQYGLGFTQLFRRTLLEFSGLWSQSSDFYNSKYREAHDQWFFFLASSLGSIYYIGEPLVLYRQHDTNTFGWDKFEQTIKGKLANLFATTTSGIYNYEISAGQRTMILEQIKTFFGPAGNEFLAAAIERYRETQQLYIKRQKIYSAPNSFRRFCRFVKALRDGCYRSKTLWGAGYQAMIRDLIRGVIFPAKINAPIE